MLFLLTYGCWPGINVEKRGWHSTAARFDCWREPHPGSNDLLEARPKRCEEFGNIVAITQ